MGANSFEPRPRSSDWRAPPATARRDAWLLCGCGGVRPTRAAGAARWPAALVIPGFLAHDRTTDVRCDARSPSGLPGPRLGMGLEPRGDEPTRSIGWASARTLVSMQSDAAGRLEPWRLFARELGRAVPERVRAVVDLGSPFSGDPQQNNVWRLYELLRGTRSTSRRSRGSPTSRRCRIWRFGREGRVRSLRGRAGTRCRSATRRSSSTARIWRSAFRGQPRGTWFARSRFLEESVLAARARGIDSGRSSCGTRTKVEQKRCELCGRRLVPGRRRRCRARRQNRELPNGSGRSLAFARAARPDPVRAVRGPPARRRLGRLPARAARRRTSRCCGSRTGWRSWKADALHPPACRRRTHPRRGARRARRAVGDGGGRKMHGAFRVIGEIVGRSAALDFTARGGWRWRRSDRACRAGWFASAAPPT